MWIPLLQCLIKHNWHFENNNNIIYFIGNFKRWICSRPRCCNNFKVLIFRRYSKFVVIYTLIRCINIYMVLLKKIRLCTIAVFSSSVLP